MPFQKISVQKWTIRACDIWDNQWLLLTCGDYSKNEFNAMTVGWGSFGIMWQRPFAQVVVRPTRFTFEFMEKYDNFTLCAFPAKYHKTLQFLGSKSGRDRNKIAESGLTPRASENVETPGYEEAELIVECKKIYWDDFKPERFLDTGIERLYPKKDYHRVYFGEIVTILKAE